MARRAKRQDVHPVFELMSANQAKYPLRTMCRVLDVCASGYYAWREQPPCRRAMANAVLVELIRTAHADSDATYGVPRVRAELLEQGSTSAGSAWPD